MEQEEIQLERCRCCGQFDDIREMGERECQKCGEWVHSAGAIELCQALCLCDRTEYHEESARFYNRLIAQIELDGMRGLLNLEAYCDTLRELAPRIAQLGKERLKRHQEIDDQETDDEERIEAV